MKLLYGNPSISKLIIFLSSALFLGLGNVPGSAGTKFSHVGEEQFLSVPDSIKKNVPAADSLDDILKRRIERYYNEKNYEACLEELEKAQKIKPRDQALNSRIIQVKGLIAEQKKKKLDFEKYMASGDAAFQKKDYLNAKAYYQFARNILPEDTLVKNRLKKTMDLIRSQKAQNTLYDVAVANADRLLQAGDYEHAREEYENALKILPGEIYPRNKINEIIRLQYESQELESQYTQAVKNGDAYYNVKNWQPALQEYKTAARIRPSAKYPQDRIRELTILIDSQRNKDDAYIQAIAKADQLFDVKTYPSARKEYENASKIKPEQPYPKVRIREIDELLAAISRTQKEYDQLLGLADSLYIAKNFIRAKLYYKQASGVKPSETYPKEMLEKLKPLVAGQEADEITVALIEKQYSSILAGAERFYKAGQLDSARAGFRKSLELKPGEVLPRKRISTIDSLFAVAAKKKALEAEYDSILKNADKLFSEKRYLMAKEDYQKARSLKPQEVYPKSRILEIEKVLVLIAADKNRDSAYNSAVKKGDSLFALRSWEPAKGEYSKALQLKPAETYPRTRIGEADKALAELARQRTLDEKYVAAIAKADQLLTAKNLGQAKEAYLEAGKLKPSEAYPGEQISKIDQLLTEIAGQKAIEEKYDLTLARAEKFYTMGTLDSALTLYRRSSEIKPAETLPKKRIAAIDSLFEAEARRKALEQEYAGILKNADKLFTEKQYRLAKEEYQKAGALKPEEIYPKSRITEIEKNLAALAADKARDSAYNSALIKGDSLFAAKSWEMSKAEYTNALRLKTAETYPKNRIAEAEKAIAGEIARQKAIDDKYNNILNHADQLLASRQFEQARSEYNNALVIKPAEQYPQDKIKEIVTALADIKAREDAYKASIARADEFLAGKKYEAARGEYENALSFKINEQYPKNKIEEINQKLIELQGKKKTFDDLVLKGDNSFTGRDYLKAKEYFSQAAALFPDEPYPKNRLERIASVTDSIFRANKGKYDKAIAEADKFFNNFEFDKAIESYTVAADFLPMEFYPRDQIAKIKRTLAENAIVDVMNTAVTVNSNDEKQFHFTPVNIASRKNNFIYLKLRNLSGKPFNILLRYGKDKTVSGGVVIRNLSTDGKINERLISVREQDVWYRNDNDWISLYPQGGDVEVTFIQISKAGKE